MMTDPLQHYWAVPPEQLAENIQTSLTDGLKNELAENRIIEKKARHAGKRDHTTPLIIFCNQFKSPIVLILIFATVISAFLGDWTDALIILIIVFGSALLSFFQEYNANNTTEKLRSQIAIKSQVIRGGSRLTIPTDDVVPGDVVLLAAGSLIPADGPVLEARDFIVNQSALTGETFPVDKKPGIIPEETPLVDRTNTVFRGTSVVSGSARMLAVHTGAETAFGAIEGSLALRRPETEFERGIRQLGYLLSEIMFVLVLSILTINIFFHKPVIDSLLFSIALAVGLTPQLLPAIININLSKGSQAMAQRGVIIRRLESIENFGSMDILCTDKTGTLTIGVVELNDAVDAQGKTFDQVMLYAALNASLQTGMPNPLDTAILKKSHPQIDAFTKVDEIPYDFTRKRLSVIVKTQASTMMITKGAFESVLAVCSSALLDGSITPIDQSMLSKLEDLYRQWSLQGYRILGIARKEINDSCVPCEPDDETNLIFCGFLMFFDPPKPGLDKTIQALDQLGVELKIITGDNHLVARHIADALQLGEVNILTGSELSAMSDQTLWNKVETTRIFAEVDPNQKERIILALKKRGHVVGYMGDGINDAPPLHSADVGISVDNAVDIAKSAADLVLLRQELDVLREGIELGRKTFANTLKYIFMATSANFGNMFSMAGASLLMPFLPMLPKQILLINFLTDLPEMTIASDNVDPVYIQRPHRWNIQFIRRFMMIFGPLSSAFDFATFGVLIWLVKSNEQVFHTGWLVESVLSASLVVFTIRSQLPIGRSRPSKFMMLATGLVILFVLVLPYTPLAAPLELVPLPSVTILILSGIILLYIICAEFTKRWFFKHYSI